MRAAKPIDCQYAPESARACPRPPPHENQKTPQGNCGQPCLRDRRQWLTRAAATRVSKRKTKHRSLDGLSVLSRRFFALATLYLQWLSLHKTRYMKRAAQPLS